MYNQGRCHPCDLGRTERQEVIYWESSKQRNSSQPRSSSARPLTGHLTDVTLASGDGQLVAATRWSCLGRVPFLKVETSSSFGLYERTLFVVNLFLLMLSNCSFDIHSFIACILTTLAWSCACKGLPLSIGGTNIVEKLELLIILLNTQDTIAYK